MLFKKKILLLGLFYLFSIFFTYAQSQLKGTVLDDTQMPIPYADILLKDSSGNWTSDRAISNESGEFKLVTKESGTYKISIISIGFEQFDSNTFNNLKLYTIKYEVNIKINCNDYSIQPFFSIDQ